MGTVIIKAFYEISPHYYLTVFGKITYQAILAYFIKSWVVKPSNASLTGFNNLLSLISCF